MPTPGRGRPVKFTLERIQQIKNLVERSKSREEIAELIGVTVNSLQVPAPGWASVCGDLPLTTDSFRCGEMNRVLIKCTRHALGMEATCPDQGATGAKCANSAGRS